MGGRPLQKFSIRFYPYKMMIIAARPTPAPLPVLVLLPVTPDRNCFLLFWQTNWQTPLASHSVPVVCVVAAPDWESSICAFALGSRSSTSAMLSSLTEMCLTKVTGC